MRDGGVGEGMRADRRPVGAPRSASKRASASASCVGVEDLGAAPCRPSASEAEEREQSVLEGAAAVARGAEDTSRATSERHRRSSARTSSSRAGEIGRRASQLAGGSVAASPRRRAPTRCRRSGGRCRFEGTERGRPPSRSIGPSHAATRARRRRGARARRPFGQQLGVALVEADDRVAEAVGGEDLDCGRSARARRPRSSVSSSTLVRADVERRVCLAHPSIESDVPVEGQRVAERRERLRVRKSRSLAPASDRQRREHRARP